ncbi:hypothetical protein HNP55_003102 [Paucibacter oligotrophus]|uniref:Uncharacterized protein n=1 Tax=Roseateles oligotrophus TaxID=1769250 RepID=A0A840LED2_9BURK|nr:hypothetical protein [Roseateles oligotrophus]
MVHGGFFHCLVSSEFFVLIGFDVSVQIQKRACSCSHRR